MFRRLSHIVLVLLLLSACGRQKGYSPLLLNSDSQCNVRPDSALVLLQQLSLLTRGLSPCAPESLASAVYLGINPSHSHDFFWTETWANYLSKGYFGRNWLGFNYPKEYPAQNISLFNLFRIKIARILP